MTSLLSIVSAALMALAVAFNPAGALGATPLPQGGTFEKPDFAFPKSVAANASATYRKALATGQPAMALQAAVQLDIASNLVDADSVGVQLSRFTSLSESLPGVWASLASMLECRLLADVYASRRWQFDSRTLPLAPRPADIYGWSGPMFAAAVDSIIGRVLSDSVRLARTPLSDITPVLVDYASCVKGGMTALDFISLQASQVYRATGQSAKADDVLRAASARHCGDANPLAAAFFSTDLLDAMPPSARRQWARECWERYRDTDAAAPFAAALASLPDAASNDERRRVCTMLSDYRAVHPDAWEIGRVDSEIRRLTTPEISLTFPGQVLPGRDVPVTLGGANLYSGYLLVYDITSTPWNTDVRYAGLRTRKPLRTYPVEIPGQSPDKFAGVKALPPVQGLPEGVYAIVFSTTGDASGVPAEFKNRSVDKLLVSSITATVTRSPQGSRLYVTSAADNAPMAGVKVTFAPTSKRQGSARTLTTGPQGFVDIPDGAWHYTAALGSARAYGSAYRFGESKTEAEERNASLLFDRSLFQPGDTVAFSLVTWTRKDHTLARQTDRTIDLVLRNPDWQACDTLRLTTDRLGRASGAFPIPRDAKAGRWNIAPIGEGWLQNASFEVAEYKAPSFAVTLEGDSLAASPDTVSLRGRAVAYSGMAVAGASYVYTLRNVRTWRFPAKEDFEMTGRGVTGPDGGLEIRFPSSELPPDYYALTVSVTDAAGETRQAAPFRFATAETRSISAGDIPALYCAEGDKAEFRVEVLDMTGRSLPVPVDYSVFSPEGEVGAGQFTAPGFSLPLKSLPSGRYTLRFALASDSTVNIEKEITLWRSDDKVPPVLTPLWIPATDIRAATGARTVSVRVGSSFPDSHLLLQISDTKRVFEYRWVEVNAGFADVSLPAPAADQRIFATFYACHDLDMKTVTVNVTPELQTVPLTITADTFRDYITPGAAERWTFRFSFDGKPQAGLPVMAVMTDRSLNDIEPFRWSLDPASALWWSSAGTVSPLSLGRNAETYRWPLRLSDPKQAYDFGVNWQTYGYGLYPAGANRISVRGVKEMKYANAALSSAKAEACAEVACDDAEASCEMAATGGSADGGGSQGQWAGLRTLDALPTMFFMPTLMTESDGIAEISFTAPDFIGTCQLQVFGYMPDMRCATAVYEIKSQRPVMARINAPRFLRTGDVAEISATVSNNTPYTADVSVRMEVYRVADGSPVCSRDFPAEQYDASQSRAVTLSFTAPALPGELGVRIVASAAGSSDGEQALFPLLAASAPVRDSSPFWLQPGQGTFEMQLPEYGADASCTLHYCDNPVWECVATLREAITPQGADVGALADALYANAVGAHICRDKAVASHAGLDPASLDSLARMQLSELETRQDEGGGWAWCPGMSASPYMTRHVLSRLGAMRRAGVDMPHLDRMARKGAVAARRDLLESWKRSSRKSLPVRQFLEYCHAVRPFGAIGIQGDFGAMAKGCLKEMESGWRKYGVWEKAMAAMALADCGRRHVASEILASVGQFATLTPQRGMWFANAGNAWNAMTPLQTTARVLEAYAMLDPGSADVDLLRQGLVTAKQTLGWERPAAAVDLVSALLSSGTTWTQLAVRPLITIDGTPLDLPEDASGCLALPLDSTAGGGVLRISRDAAGPAWGGVVTERILPIADVKAAGVPQLRIAKRLVVVRDGTPCPDGTPVAPGDLVRVTLTLTTDRDMEYVTVDDSRAACLEPMVQTSGYTSADGLRYYREVRDTATRLYIEFLPKGTHVLTYDTHADRTGRYALGIATADCTLAPTVTARSAGTLLPVTP